MQSEEYFMLFYFIFDHRHTSLFIHQSLIVSHFKFMVCLLFTVYYAEVKGQFWPRPELIIYLSIYLSIPSQVCSLDTVCPCRRSRGERWTD